MSLGARSAAPAVSVIDILDRVLDKGLVVAGDISISLANVELLTIRVRLLICSIDKAEQIGLNWWRYDRNLVAPAVAGAATTATTASALEQRVDALEKRINGPVAKKRRDPARKR